MTGQSIALYLSQPSACNYLSEEFSQSAFIDPRRPIDMPIYSALIKRGFRRSGQAVYRPHCPACQQCLSVRIPVADFNQRRRHRRIMQVNQQVNTELCPAELTDEHYSLYQSYIVARHPEGGMADASAESLQDFLTADWCDTVFMELREYGRLIGVAVIDQVVDGWSAVYTFFDPQLSQRSLGGFAILQQLTRVQQIKLPYLYLGYWIRDSPKMAYKADYRPLEIFSEEHWQRFEQGQTIDLPELS